MSGGDALEGRPGIILRPAAAADADLLLAWANDPATRDASLSRGPIVRAEHLAWLDRVLGDPSRRLWIGTVAGDPVGLVRIDAADGEIGIVSISIAARARGRGLSGPMLDAALAAAEAELGTRRYRALVRASNAASRRLFLRARFDAVGEVQSPDGEAVIVYERVADA